MRFSGEKCADFCLKSRKIARKIDFSGISEVMRIFIHEMRFLSHYLLTTQTSCAILLPIENDRGAVHQKYMPSQPHHRRCVDGMERDGCRRRYVRTTELGLSRRSAELSNGMFGVLSKHDSAPLRQGNFPTMR